MPNANARQLRAHMTDAERRLWRVLRQRGLDGHRFRRQHPIGPYIVDFICLKQRVIVEVDGSQHSEPEHQLRDLRRDQWLQAEGYVVYRISNIDVHQNLIGAMETLFQELTNRAQMHR
jgi:very-short-patch-repair endonuclease